MSAGATVDRYQVNDTLSALAASLGIFLDDDTLNDLTHHVADVLDAARDDVCPPESGGHTSGESGGGTT